MNEEYKKFLDERLKILRYIFPDKTIEWINDNISYHYFNNQNILNDYKLKKIVAGLNKNLDEKDILWLLLWIEYSYIPANVIVNFFPNIIMASSKLEKRDLVKYYIMQQKNNIFVSFRGTKTLWETINSLKFYRVKFDLLNEKEKNNFFNWRDSFIKVNSFNSSRIPLIEDSDIEIHKGFLDEANLIYSDVVENIAQIINPNCKKTQVILCGHSLGGVLANIIGIYLAFFLRKAVDENRFSISIVTANTPPMGNKNFNLLIPYLKIRNYVRLYNYQDFVPYYGYYGTWIESKKFRHLDFMLKNGIEGSGNIEDRNIVENIGKTKVFVKDYGKNLDLFIQKINLEKGGEVDINKKYLYHDFFNVIKRNKILFI